MARPGKRERRRAKDRDNQPTPERLNATVRGQQERISKNRGQGKKQEAVVISREEPTATEPGASTWNVICATAARTAAITAAELFRQYQPEPARFVQPESARFNQQEPAAFQQRETLAPSQPSN